MKERDLYILPFLFVGLLVTSCSMGDVYDANSNKKASEANFVSKFGDIAPDQNWININKYTANITVKLGIDANYTVGIFDKNPLYSKNYCTIVTGNVAEGGTFSTAFEGSNSKMYYIGVYDSKGREIVKSDTIKDGVLNSVIGETLSSKSKAATRSNFSSVSTDPAAYQISESKFIPSSIYNNNYYDVTNIPSYNLLSMDKINYNTYPFSYYYGDGKHYVIPAGAKVKANLDYSQSKDGNCVILVNGTWEVPYSISFSNNQIILVAEGGKIIFDGDAHFNSGAHFMNKGSIETKTGTIYIENWSGDEADCYNSGTMTLNNGGLSVAGNNSQLYNKGTMTMKYLDARGNCTFTNFGSLTALSTSMVYYSTSGQGTAASNFNFINCCYASIGAAGIYELILCNNSRLDCPTGIYTGGGNGGIIIEGDHSVISAGDWIDNGGSFYGPNEISNAAVFKFTGSISEYNAGVFSTLGYLYYDGTFDESQVLVRYILNKDPWNKPTINYIKYTTSESTSAISIPKGDCTGSGYNPDNSGGDIPKTDPAYTIAFEDLGSTDDFDFNDIVLYVYPYTQSQKMKVELVAAGGIMPIDVYFGTTKLFTKNDGKITNTTTRGNVIASQSDIPLPSGFTLTNSDYASLFSIKVNGASSTYDISTNKVTGMAPQAIVIAGKWDWPLERVPIDNAYPKFLNWVKDKTVDWVTQHDVSKCIQ
jgi:hypothetical protein